MQHILGPAPGFGAVTVCELASLVKLLELEIQSEINTVPQWAGHGKPFCASQSGIGEILPPYQAPKHLNCN